MPPSWAECAAEPQKDLNDQAFGGGGWWELGWEDHTG